MSPVKACSLCTSLKIVNKIVPEIDLKIDLKIDLILSQNCTKKLYVPKNCTKNYPSNCT